MNEYTSKDLIKNTIMHGKVIVFEECYISEEYETVTGYFIISKTVLEILLPNKYPEAEHGEISIEYPINNPEVGAALCMVSPTKDGSDYDWNDYLFCNEVIGYMIDITEKHRNK